MDQVLLITTYKEFDYLKRFVSKVSSEDIGVVIHIDRKTSTDKLLAELNSIPNVFAISRYVVHWGSIQHVYSILEIMKIALTQWPSLKYVHIITGQDILSRSIDEFKSFFSDSKKNYLSMHDAMDDITTFRWKTFYRNDYINYKSKLGKIITKAIHVLQKPIVRRQTPNDWHIYKGMVYASLTCQFAKYVIEFCNNENGKRFIKWLKWCFIPEEFFFQSIIMNSKYASTVDKCNYRYALWKEKHGANPGVLDMDDYCEIKDFPCFFARKMSSIESAELIDKLLDK